MWGASVGAGIAVGPLLAAGLTGCQLARRLLVLAVAALVRRGRGARALVAESRSAERRGRSTCPGWCCSPAG